jgi:hypothetical protein
MAEEKLQQQFQRDINRCSDSDRNMRKRGLQKLLQDLPWAAPASEQQQHEALQKLCLNILFPLLVPLVHDPIEKCREYSLAILRKIVELYSPIDERLLLNLLQELCQRVGELPFPEQGEELRLQIVELLQLIARQSFSSDFFQSFEEILLPTVAKGFQDTFPAAKRCWSEIMITLSRATSPSSIQRHHKALLKGLLPNCAHQHHKVRSLTMKVWCFSALLSVSPSLCLCLSLSLSWPPLSSYSALPSSLRLFLRSSPV